MRYNLFYSSSSLENIRFNVIILHALCLIAGGLYLVYAGFSNDDLVKSGRLILGFLTMAFGVINIVAAKIRTHFLISVSLIIWFTLLIYHSFNVIDHTLAAIGINMALLSLIVLVTIYYSSIGGMSILLLISAINIYRLIAFEYGHITPLITDSTGIFETNVLAILSLYICTIAGYYQHQAQVYLSALQSEKELLISAVSELRAKEQSLLLVFDKIQLLSKEKLPLIKPKLHHYLENINSGDEQDFKHYLKSGDASMQYIDEVLRSIDEQIKSYDD